MSFFGTTFQTAKRAASKAELEYYRAKTRAQKLKKEAGEKAETARLEADKLHYKAKEATSKVTAFNKQAQLGRTLGFSKPKKYSGGVFSKPQPRGYLGGRRLF